MRNKALGRGLSSLLKEEIVPIEIAKSEKLSLLRCCCVLGKAGANLALAAAFPEATTSHDKASEAHDESDVKSVTSSSIDVLLGSSLDSKLFRMSYALINLSW